MNEIAKKENVESRNRRIIPYTILGLFAVAKLISLVWPFVLVSVYFCASHYDK